MELTPLGRVLGECGCGQHAADWITRHPDGCSPAVGGSGGTKWSAGGGQADEGEQLGVLLGS